MRKKIINNLIRIMMVMLSAMSFFPVWYMVSHSLKRKEEIIKIYTSTSVTSVIDKIFLQPFIINFGQYDEILLRTPEFLSFFWNSVYIVFPIIIFQLFFSLLGAYGFSKLKFKGSEILFFMYIIIMLMPFQVTLVPNYIILNKLGLLDKYAALILPGIFGTFGIFFLKQYMESIPDVYLEEARLQGAGEWKILLYVFIPMSKAVIGSVAILLFIDYWNMVEQPLLFLYTQEKYPLSVYLVEIGNANIGVAFASSVIYMMLPMLLTLYTEDDLIGGIGNIKLK